MNRKPILILANLLVLIGLLIFAGPVQKVKASETIYIRADGSIDPETAPIAQVSNVLYTFTDDIFDSIIIHRENVVLDGSGYTLHGNRNANSGISLPVRNNITLKNLKIHNFTIGISLSETCGDGCFGSSYNTISGNEIVNNDFGIMLSSLSQNNQILQNNIISNTHGIFLAGSQNNTLRGNVITGSSQYGIWLSQSSNNDITKNHFSDNHYGINLEYSSSNHFHHNYFINNNQHVFVSLAGYTNSWNDPLEGNYWSDYMGGDANHDGIGDSLYLIDGSNRDHSPLMGTFSEFNSTPGPPIQTISNSSISDFEFNGTAVIFTVTGQKGESGFCRLRIPTMLMETPHYVFVNGTHILHTLLDPSNSIYTYLYFTYDHSMQEVVIIPEFPVIQSLLLVLLLLTLVITFSARAIHR